MEKVESSYGEKILNFFIDYLALILILSTVIFIPILIYEHVFITFTPFQIAPLMVILILCNMGAFLISKDLVERDKAVELNITFKKGLTFKSFILHIVPIVLMLLLILAFVPLIFGDILVTICFMFGIDFFNDLLVKKYTSLVEVS
jgi:hypothetical protein